MLVGMRERMCACVMISEVMFCVYAVAAGAPGCCCCMYRKEKKKLSAKSIHAHVCVGTAIYNSIVFICLFIDLDLIFY